MPMAADAKDFTCTRTIFYGQKCTTFVHETDVRYWLPAYAPDPEAQARRQYGITSGYCRDGWME